VFFSIGKVDLANNDTSCFLQNQFRYIITKIFGHLDLITLFVQAPISSYRDSQRSSPQDLGIYRSKMLSQMKRVSGRANALQR
jgi:hypothetical protein